MSTLKGSTQAPLNNAAQESKAETKASFGVDSVWMPLVTTAHALAAMGLMTQITHPTHLAAFCFCAVLFIPMVLPIAQITVDCRAKNKSRSGREDFR
jgi:hypothetical protein